MKLLFLLLLGITLNISPSYSNISYTTDVITSHESLTPLEKQKFKKENRTKKYKKNKHPEKIQENIKTIWSLVLGFILLAIAIFVMIIAAIMLFGFALQLSQFVFYIGLFFLACSLPFLIIGFTRLKNRGVREKNGNTNEGKATY